MLVSKPERSRKVLAGTTTAVVLTLVLIAGDSEPADAKTVRQCGAQVGRCQNDCLERYCGGYGDDYRCSNRVTRCFTRCMDQYDACLVGASGAKGDKANAPPKGTVGTPTGTKQPGLRAPVGSGVFQQSPKGSGGPILKSGRRRPCARRLSRSLPRNRDTDERVGLEVGKIEAGPGHGGPGRNP
jgi:hypothetical protein